MVERFENRMVEHLQHCFPRKCIALTESGLRAEIRHGIQKARGYGFENELEICKYVNLMFIFGRDFDIHEEPWASACRHAGDRRGFKQNWDEAYDALIERSAEAKLDA
jgi:hypothetical protein